MSIDPATIRVLASGLLVLGIAFALLRWLQARIERGGEVPAPAMAHRNCPRRTNWPGERVGAARDRQRGSMGMAGAGTEGIVVKEAVSDLEKAEVFLSAGLEAKAVEALDHAVKARPDQTVGPWMKLLTLYRKTNRRDAFVETSARLRVTYNIRFPDSPERHTTPAPATIEAYPRIVEHLVGAWDTPDCLADIDNLLHDSRGGHRTGFSPSVIEELELLKAVLVTRLTDEAATRH